ncbi:MAG TPA: hypothetical protein VLJ61_17325 [Pyrinomonadaceae bacterium]|nr:hypothetical protein [Pyrinomonadaceae bacterium]
MSEISSQMLGRKSGWTLSARAFQRLLDWLDEGVSSDGQKYLEMQRRLASYFDRKDCALPDELADETLNRVARRLEEEGGVIESDAPARYCYIVARFVFMEHLREARRNGQAPLDDARAQARAVHASPPGETDEKEFAEKRLNCLEQCMEELKPPNRTLILRYYTGRQRIKIENRRALAEELSLTMNALSIRACRIREKLEACVRRCAGAA